jgi:glycosyltransferase involved in cell wall biosynthesis
MKYPFIIFYRKDKYNNIDNFFIENAHSIDFTVFIANCAENVKCLHDSNFQILVTYGDSFEEYNEELLSIISIKMLIRHIHLTAIDTVDNLNIEINNALIKLCLTPRENVRPTFSLFTSAFNSYDKILRVYKSLENQTLTDWEWIIVDDSPDDAHFNFLRSIMMDDPRIRLYRRSKNNGSIGNVKNETIGLCRGKYVLEMDHDDEILPFVLKESAELFDKDATIGFIYMDCACVYENGLNQTYGDFICKGYGAYYSQKYKDKWRLVYITPNINNITLSHLTCCPNHPRIWRRKTLMELDSYCEYLPICDDYEIILKTCVSTKVAKIHKLGYIQYMNDSNNNFSLIRNSEINRIGPNYISPIYYEYLNVHETMKQNDA